MKAAARRVLFSLKYHALARGSVASEATRLRDSWKHVDLPARQRPRVERELAAFRQGHPVPIFDIMVSAQYATSGSLMTRSQSSKIGCSSGYYSEVISPVDPGFTYSGCDYSPALIDMARRLYPDLKFDVEDATALHYDADAFDVVVAGCCLLHIPGYRTGLAETARVARTFAIFHRTPVVIGQPEKVYRKRAYGVETVEIHFNEHEFLALLQSNGLELIASHTLTEMIANGKGSAMRTYVCRKVAA